MQEHRTYNSAATVRGYCSVVYTKEVHHIGAVSFRAPCIVFFLVASAPVKHEDISAL